MTLKAVLRFPRIILTRYITSGWQVIIAVGASILIVTRNRKEFLKFTLEKARRQVRRGDQLVLIDDASDERISVLTESFVDKCETTFIRHDSHVGYIGCRNEGILACKHECIVQLDDDSWMVERDALDTGERMLSTHPMVGAFALAIHYHYSKAPDECGNSSKRWRLPHLAREWGFQGCGVVLRRSVVVKAGLYPAYYGYGLEEVALGLRLFRLGYEIRMCRDIRVIHGHETLSEQNDYNDTRASNPLVGIAGNEICLAKESLCWPFSEIMPVITLALGMRKGLTAREIWRDYLTKRRHIRKDLRLSLGQTIKWLKLRRSTPPGVGS